MSDLGNDSMTDSEINEENRNNNMRIEKVKFIIRELLDDDRFTYYLNLRNAIESIMDESFEQLKIILDCYFQEVIVKSETNPSKTDYQQVILVILYTRTKDGLRNLQSLFMFNSAKTTIDCKIIN
jgi:hypothetical protein